MTIEEIKAHLSSGDLHHTLYVVERQTSRRGIPNIVSFYIVVDGKPINLDAELVKLIGEGARRIKVGRVLAASIHDPYMHTLEKHMEDLSSLLFTDPKKLVWQVI